MKTPRALIFAAVAAAASVGADKPLSRDAHAFPPISALPATPFTPQDVAFASVGFRAAGADAAWVQMLQYAAGNLPEYPDPPGVAYGRIKDLALRIVRLDPSFHRGYTYAAGILGWFHGVDRADEAVELLEEGRLHDPGQKMYGMYIAALAYMKKGDSESMVRLLDGAYDDPQTSPPMRAILANIHLSRGEYEKSLAIWKDILSGERDATEHGRARVEIPKIERLIRERAAEKRPPR
jgi:hypothetical protein